MTFPFRCQILWILGFAQVLLFLDQSFCVNAADPTPAPSYSTLVYVSQVINDVSYTDYESNVDTFDEVMATTACASIGWIVDSESVSISSVASVSTDQLGSDDSSVSVQYTIDSSGASGYSDTIEAESAISSLLVEAVNNGNFTAKLLEKAEKYDATFMYDASSNSVTVTVAPTLAPTAVVVGSPTQKPTHSPTLNESTADQALITVAAIVGFFLFACLILPVIMSYLWSAPKLEHPPVPEGDSETSSLLGRRRDSAWFGGGPKGGPAPNLKKYSVLIRRQNQEDGLEDSVSSQKSAGQSESEVKGSGDGGPPSASA